MTLTTKYQKEYFRADVYQSDVQENKAILLNAQNAFYQMPNSINYNELMQAMFDYQHLRLNARDCKTGLKAFRTMYKTTKIPTTDNPPSNLKSCG